MEQKTVMNTVLANMCSGCGVCKGICPKGCISWKKMNGLYVSQIDEQRCVHCGLCADVCPGAGHSYEKSDSAVSTVTGSVIKCYNAWSKDPKLRHISASGGVVSTIVRTLLKAGTYDAVFTLDTYDYRDQLKTRCCCAEDFSGDWNRSSTPKSRYLPVSHEDTVSYIKENPDARLIIIGTSCAIRGLESAVKRMNLDREQYLFIGLFCDKIFNYNVITYFEDKFCHGKPLKALHFKNKESGGWPGDMKFFPKNSEPFYISKDQRGNAKAYFMPERCLYCVDKLNVQADIALGDNYTNIASSELGSNSVIIRTLRGLSAWERAAEHIEAVSIGVEAIQTAQDINWRLNNLYFGDLKAVHLGKKTDLNRNVPREQDPVIYERAWRESLKKLRAGQDYDKHPKKLKRRMKMDCKKSNPVVSFCKRGYYFLKRKIK